MPTSLSRRTALSFAIGATVLQVSGTAAGRGKGHGAAPKADGGVALRRCMTAVDDNGRARLFIDEAPASARAFGSPLIVESYDLWGTGRDVVVPYRAALPDAGLSRPAGLAQAATNAAFMVWPARASTRAEVAGLMHETDTVDYIFIVSGEITCFLEGGDEILLRPGSCLVQTGTCHSWQNTGPGECLMAVVSVGAKRG